MNKLSIQTAAMLMGKSQQFIRIGLQRGTLPIGKAVEMKPGRYSYYISPALFQEFTGIDPAKKKEGDTDEQL